MPRPAIEDLKATLQDVDTRPPDKTIAIAGEMDALIKSKEWGLYLNLLAVRRVREAFMGYHDPERPPLFYAGVLAGLDYAASIPEEIIAEAGDLMEAKKARDNAIYERGGDGDLS